MKFSNTLIVNCSVMPGKKAFTLAEVLITLSILGVVAALTIPSLVNRQSEMAAIVKMKKAISQYEQVSEVYMAENDADTFDVSCGDLGNYFKIVSGTAASCNFTTADGVRWVFGSGAANAGGKGNAIAFDASSNTPKFGVLLWTKGGVANGVNAVDGVVTAPEAADFATVPNGISPSEGYYTANRMLKVESAKSLKVGNTDTKTASSSVANAITDIGKAITAAGTRS